MATKLIELEYPTDGRRKATIVTNNKDFCEYMAKYPNAKVGVHIITEKGNHLICLGQYGNTN